MMNFQREYAESYDWLVEVFRDWAFTFFSSFLYYQDYDKLDENERSLYRQEMATFGCVAPSYHIELRDRPTLIWDFNSLLLCIQMMFSFMLTDDNSSLNNEENIHMNKSNIIMYTTEDGLTKIETTFDEDTVWLSIDQIRNHCIWILFKKTFKYHTSFQQYNYSIL